MQGNTDKPIGILEDDKFEIEPYVEGLAEFVEECDTPMTIAIQGDWGCGKTSMMNMVKGYFDEGKVASVWFNTWQFSQFNMDEQLAVTFLQHLINEIKKLLDDNIREEVVNKLSSTMKTITVGMTRQFVGEGVGNMMKELITNKLDFIDEISGLKENFRKLVDKATNNGEKRIVVFVDDLDRLQPVRAVELLEIMKLFIDCEHCIFIMAIDTSVVFRGIREKYGDDMSDEKAQSFFDKMIQMPFKMPVAYYKLDSMMEDVLDFLRDESLSKEDKNNYIRLFKKVTNGNPRSLKRLANSILLTEKVAEKKGFYNQEQTDVRIAIRRIWVILACIQLKYEVAYNFLVNDIDYRNLSLVLNLPINKWMEADKGQKLICELMAMGMPEVEVQEPLVFYTVIEQYQIALNKYINCIHAHGVSENTAVLQVMKIITLNDVIDNGIEERAHEVTRVEDNESAKISTAYLYAGMCACGQYKTAYDSLVSRGLYLPLRWIEQGEKGTELDTYRHNEQSINNFALFIRIDELLHGYQNRSKDERIQEDILGGNEDIVTYYKEVHRDYTFAKICCKIRYRRRERSLLLDAIVEEIEPVNQTTVFVDTLKDIYEKLQENYSIKLVRKLKDEIDAKRDSQGGVTQLKINGFPILNEEMADAIIDYFKYIFKEAENLCVRRELTHMERIVEDATSAMVSTGVVQK